MYELDMNIAEGREKDLNRIYKPMRVEKKKSRLNI